MPFPASRPSTLACASAVLPARRTAGVRLVQSIIQTPLGAMTALANDSGLMGLWFDAQRHSPGTLCAVHDSEQRWIAQTRIELAEYFAGTRRCFDVALAPQGTLFQEAVWKMLCEIDHGQTRSYGAIGQSLGKPLASRAVGAAVGRNPISILVPCHRIIGGAGGLTGYAGGLHRKHTLLALERASAPCPEGRFMTAADEMPALL